MTTPLLTDLYQLNMIQAYVDGGVLIKHPLTDIGIEKFLKDWEKVPKRP